MEYAKEKYINYKSYLENREKAKENKHKEKQLDKFDDTSLATSKNDMRGFLISKKKSKILDTQNEVINFCQDMNNLQNKSNIYDTKLMEQMDFSHCVDTVTDKLKEDYDLIQKNLNNCYDKCHSRFENDNLTINHLNKVVNNCVTHCQATHNILNDVYYDYMIKNKGIYFEFVDYNKYLN